MSIEKHSKETKEKISKIMFKNSNNGKDCYYKFTNPEGKEIIVGSNFNSFCKINNIPKRTVGRYINEKNTNPMNCGWKVEKIKL